MLKDHRSFVYCVAANPYNRLILTGDYDGAIRAFDPVSGKCISNILAHSEAVASICLSPTCEVIATGGHDGLVRVWDTMSTDISGCLLTLVADKQSPM